MHRRQTLALGGATLAVVLASSAVALAAGGTKVTVRVEGATHTLLAPKTVQTHAGSITKGGAPPGMCAATSAAGALDVATRHAWAGKWFASVPGIFVTSIFGEKPTGNDFWELFRNNVPALGICAVNNLHRGDQLLFAATNGAEHPLALIAPAHARLNHALAVKVVWFSNAGVKKPLAGTRVTGNGASATTDAHGIAHFLPSAVVRLVFTATHKGYIRAAPVSVRVSG